MKYLIFCQTPYNSVRFMTNELQDYTSLGYKKFLDMLMTLPCNDYLAIRKHLDCFQTVFLNLETGEFKQLLPERGEATFEELVRINQVEEQKSIQEQKTESSKSFLDSFAKWRKQNDSFNRYKR